MTDMLAAMPPKILQCLVVACNPTAADGERITAWHVFDQYLKSLGYDGYELVKRITTEPVSEEDMKTVFDAGREQGRSEVIEQQRRTPPVSAQSFFNTGLSGISRSSSYSFDDRARIAGHDIHNGYQWSAIATHCAGNLLRIPAKHHGFLEDMAARLARFGGTVSGAQAKYLGNLFNQYLSGRI
jgi:hypothetical protein